MWNYTVLKHPTLGYKAVRTDTQPLGFIFSFLWLAYQKAWAKAFACFVMVIGGLMLWDALFGQVGSYIPAILVTLLVGFKGSAWIIEALEKRGYEKLKEVQARSVDDAIASAVKEGANDA